jgi:hypothetical protein
VNNIKEIAMLILSAHDKAEGDLDCHYSFVFHNDKEMDTRIFHNDGRG